MVLTAVDTRTNGDGVDTPRPVGKEKKEKLTLVECTWIDAYTEASWSEYDASSENTKTYGLLVDQTDEWTTLAMSRDSSFWGNLWYIPTKNVVSLREIEKVQST